MQTPLTMFRAKHFFISNTISPSSIRRTRLGAIRAISILGCIASLLTLSLQIAASANDCGTPRLPALEANNPNIECAVLLDDELVFPRNVLYHGGQIWLADKGSNLFSNGQQSGAIYRYQKTDQGLIKTKILDELDEPNDIGVRQHASGDFWLYFTTRDSIQRINISAPLVSKPKPIVVLDNLPTWGWHKLLAFEITQRALFLTVPSLTDHCEVEGISGLVEYPCSEESVHTATIRHYAFDDDQLNAKYAVAAFGLRDALATKITPDNTRLIAADNGWDQINLSDTGFNYDSTPHDEVNVIDLAKTEHFGWPYCFDNNSITPPYQRFIQSCSTYKAPTTILPAHSAPLTMSYFNEQLLVNLHGNNKSGAKTISYRLNKLGLPLDKPQTIINWQTNKDSSQALPRPFGLSKKSNSTILVTDDWNHQLVEIMFKVNSPL